MEKIKYGEIHFLGNCMCRCFYRERHIPLWAIQNVFYIKIAHRWAKNQ